jgi:hypothetical protein
MQPKVEMQNTPVVVMHKLFGDMTAIDSKHI